MQKKFINPAETHKPRGYTHAVVAEAGKVVFIAGQVAFDADGQLVGKGDLRAQAQKAFENLFAALKAAVCDSRRYRQVEYLYRQL
jgi:enamine deaminase RidA (YjgF/YER057c/UK114 family)